MSQSIWLKSDEQREALRALEILHGHLGLAEREPISWKWALVALHNAVQNFIVASLAGPALLGVLRPHIAERWEQTVAGLLDRGSPPIPDYFLDLYQHMKEVTGFRPPIETDVAVARLNEHRNAFIHFTPASWLVHLNELPGLAQDCLVVVERLGWKPGHIDWQEDALRESAEREFRACLEALEVLELRYRI